MQQLELEGLLHCGRSEITLHEAWLSAQAIATIARGTQSTACDVGI